MQKPPTVLRSAAWFCFLCLMLFDSSFARAQTATPLQPNAVDQILERLDRLENENRSLTEEVRALRRDLAATRGDIAPEAGSVQEKPTVQEQLEVQKNRIEE